MVHHHLVSSLQPRGCAGSLRIPPARAAWPKIGEAADVAARLQTGHGGLAPASRDAVLALCAQQTSDSALLEPTLQMARAVPKWRVEGN